MSQAPAPFKHISPQAAKDLLDSNTATFVDIRDPTSRAIGYIPASVHLNNENADAFLQNADKALPLVIYCYHGNSSQIAAEFLAQQGFADVHTMDGGFDTWQLLFPDCYQTEADAAEAD
jgi:thiosulfate sulfurtransferase